MEEANLLLKLPRLVSVIVFFLSRIAIRRRYVLILDFAGEVRDQDSHMQPVQETTHVFSARRILKWVALLLSGIERATLKDSFWLSALG